jgi:hypothetical protein
VDGFDCVELIAHCGNIYLLNGFSNRPPVFFLTLFIGDVAMKQLQKSLLLILGLLCLLLSSCVDSDNPLSDPKHSTVDPGLLGVWRARSPEGEVTYYHVGQVGGKFPAGMLRVKGITHNKNGELPRPDINEMLVFTTTLGNNHYLNLTTLNADRFKSVEDFNWEPFMAEGYFIFKYDIREDKLIIAGMDPEQKEAAIKTGKIKGIVEGDKVRITDTTENLARFVADADPDKLFTTKETKDKTYMTLERVK